MTLKIFESNLLILQMGKLRSRDAKPVVHQATRMVRARKPYFPSDFKEAGNV